LKKAKAVNVAVPHMKIKTGGAGKAAPHAEYIAREGEYSKRLEKGEKLEYTEYGNMPKWAEHNPSEFWKAADLYERKNGSTYREFEIALPRELSEKQRIELVQEWVKQEIGDQHPYQLAIHNPKAMDGGEQPHAHIMFNERKLDGIDRDPDQYFKRFNSKNPERGGCQKLNTGKDYAVRKQEIKEVRERWETMCNRSLERAGLNTRVNMKSLKDQGIDQAPERKYMPSEARDPEKRAELMAFRESRKTAQIRHIAPQEVKQGLDSTMKRFEAYKLKQQQLEQQKKAAEMEKSRLAAEAKKAIEIERQRQAQAQRQKTRSSKSKGMERD
jgi:hypothetical protein